MKNLLLLLTFILVVAESSAQHVINNDFERGTQPTALGQINHCDGYFAARGTPDYFRADGVASVGVPLNYYGFQEDCSICGGTSYAGFAPGEIFGYELDIPLTTLSNYKVTLKINLSTNSSWTATGMGLIFGTHANALGGTYPNAGYFVDNPIYHSHLVGWNTLVAYIQPDSDYTHVFIGHLKEGGRVYPAGERTGGTAYYYVGYLDIQFLPLAVEDTVIPFTKGQLMGATDMLGRKVANDEKGLVIEEWSYNRKTYFRKVFNH